MPPVADFVCLSKKCQRKDGRSPTYELPIKAVACPACGSRKVKRLFNQVNVRIGRTRPDAFDPRRTSSSMAVRTDALVEEPVTAALAKRDELRQAGQRWPRDNGMVRPVPVRGLGPALQQVYQGHQQPVTVDASALGKKATLGGRTNAMVEAIQEVGMPRGTVVARDTEYKVVRGKDGPEAAKA